MIPSPTHFTPYVHVDIQTGLFKAVGTGVRVFQDLGDSNPSAKSYHSPSCQKGRKCKVKN